MRDSDAGVHEYSHEARGSFLVLSAVSGFVRPVGILQRVQMFQELHEQRDDLQMEQSV